MEELEEAEKKSNQADEIVAFFSGQGGEVTSAVSKDVGGQSLEVNEGETESKPSQDIREDSVVRREGQSGTNEPLSYQAQTAEVESLPDNSELTATDPMLANVFPPGPVTTASSEPVPSAPPLSVTPLSVTPQLPPSYDQIIGQAPIGSVTGAQMTPPPALQVIPMVMCCFFNVMTFTNFLLVSSSAPCPSATNLPRFSFSITLCFNSSGTATPLYHTSQHTLFSLPV